MNKYWEKRAAREMYGAMKKPEQIANKLMKLYIAAANRTASELDHVFDRYVTTTGLSEEEAEELLERIDSYDMADVLKELKKNPKNKDLVQKFEAAAYKYRLNVLAQTYADITYMLESIASTADKSIEQMLEDISDRAYYHSIFEIQKRTGVGYRFRMVTPEKITEILGRNWTGANYSSRIWSNTEKLAEKVKYEITKKLLTGSTLHDVTQEIQKEFASGYYEARRLARTEANYAANQLQLQAYKESGIEKYRYLATLDLRTSKICRSLDNKVFEVAKATVGKNYPPMHPFCRSTTTAYIPDEWLKNMTRNAIDPKTGKRIKIPANMNYEDWYNKYVKGQGLTKAKERKGRNLTLEQYNRYKARLGDDFPLTYNEFINMKEDSDEWARWQERYRNAR